MTDLGFGSLGLGQQPIFDPDTAFPPLHRSVIQFLTLGASIKSGVDDHLVGQDKPCLVIGGSYW